MNTIREITQEFTQEITDKIIKANTMNRVPHNFEYLEFNTFDEACRYYNINPKTYNINNSGSLEIEWSEGDHKSSYDPSWLRENCYTLKNKAKYQNYGEDFNDDNDETENKDLNDF